MIVKYFTLSTEYTQYIKAVKLIFNGTVNKIILKFK